MSFSRSVRLGLLLVVALFLPFASSGAPELILDEDVKTEAEARPGGPTQFSILHVEAGRVNIFLSHNAIHRYQRRGADNQLELEVASDTLFVTRHYDGDLIVEAPEIRKIVVQAGTCIIHSSMTFPELTLELGGISNLRLLGSGTRLLVNQEGITNLDLSGYDCQTVEGKLQGGNSILEVSDSLKLGEVTGNLLVNGTTRLIEYSVTGNADAWFSPAEFLKLSADGNNTIVCEGKVDRAELTLNGNAEAILTPVSSLKAKLDGNGNCLVHAMPGQLEKETKGTGDVELLSDPQSRQIVRSEKAKERILKEVMAAFEPRKRGSEEPAGPQETPAAVPPEAPSEENP